MPTQKYSAMESGGGDTRPKPGLPAGDPRRMASAMGARRTQRADGIRSREAILLASAKLATTHGLEALSIGDLASHIGMSKSGLYAHFGSKEELELATIEIATEIFQKDVIAPAMREEPGLARLNGLVDRFLSHVQRRVFPGGCFFAAVSSELDTRPGKARDRICQIQQMWIEQIARCIADAQAADQLDSQMEVEQTAFEIQAMLSLANSAFVPTGDVKLLKRGRRGVDHILGRAGARPSGSTRRR